MFKILDKYNNKGYFIFENNDNLNNKCNAPTNQSGVYLFYDNKTHELLYIGRSGELRNGEMFVRQGGIKDRLVNGHQFGRTPRRNSLPLKMNEENIQILRVEWYITHNAHYADCPKEVESQLLNIYEENNGNLPRWNSQGG